jgi:dihydrofolate reductase
MKITIVAAVAKNRVIGAKNALPWHIPEDLKHFKEVTTGKTVLMGKKTFDSILNSLKKPLPNRTNVVITRQEDFIAPEGVIVFHDLDQALQKLSAQDEVMVIGGGQIYNQTIEKADKLILTEIDQDIEGDIFFPNIDPHQWKKVSEDPHAGFSFVEYERI